ncbi:hypothetical protein LPJ55_003204 [Coemansia sp. RSA 990]|nr:hypothetical protein LPJ55_003204 [Coemansia sp. RSA 990]
MHSTQERQDTLAGTTSTRASEIDSVPAREGQSTIKVGFNVLNTIIGSGILCLPYTLHNAGFVFGLGMLVAVAFLSQFSLYALVVSGKRTGNDHFSSLTKAALGSSGYHLLNYSIIIDMVGTVILYLMIIGDMVSALGNIYLPFAVTRAGMIAVVSVVVILPLLFFRNTGPLAAFSIFSIICIPYIILAVAIRAPQYAGEVDVDFSFFGPRVLPAMGVLAFAYGSCHAAFPNYSGLRDRAVKPWVQATSFATTGAIAISSGFAISGFLSFGSSAQANILENFPETDSFINLGRLLFLMSLVFTTPLSFYPIRDTVTEMLKIDPQRHHVSPIWESICTVCLFSFCAISAMLFSNLGLAFELIGTLSSSVVNFIIPGLVFLSVGTDVTVASIVSRWRSRANRCEGASERDLLLLPAATGHSGTKPHLKDICMWVLAWVAAVFGVWVMILGTFNVWS